MTPAPPRPQMWLSLPPGFFPSTELDEGDRTALLDSLTEGLSEPAAAVVAEAVEVSQRQVASLRGSRLTFSASGLHPREDGGVDLSTLTAGVVPVPPGPPVALLLAVARAEEARPETGSVTVRDLPAGPAVVAERHQEAGDPAVGLHSIRVTFAAPEGGHLAVVEVTTKAADRFDAYREVALELIAPSVTFDDPALTAAAPTGSTRLADRLGARTMHVGSSGEPQHPSTEEGHR